MKIKADHKVNYDLLNITFRWPIKSDVNLIFTEKRLQLIIIYSSIATRYIKSKVFSLQYSLCFYFKKSRKLF